MTSERRISDLPRILILLLSPGDFFSNISDIYPQLSLPILFQ